MPPGTRFGEFEIIRVLGVGGFGIVYLAQDHSLERQVALKEYMPASLAARGDGPLITVRSSSFVETYAIGLRSFINEARLLARFDHPSLVKVYRFWEDNVTAYMVMPYLEGITLRDARRAMTHAPDEAWLRSVLDPMLDALEQLHGEGVFHRDIAPDNILLPPTGAPILLDFGAARRVISDRTQSLTAILKPSYAPIEQYADMTGMRQGPWTDLYALGAVMHFLLFGAPPAPATTRALQGDAGQIEQRVVPGVSPRFLSVVAWMLGVRPLERPQSVAALRAVLKGDAPILSPARSGVTAPGDITPIPVASAAVPLSEVAPDPAFEPTMVVDRVHAPPTHLDTGCRPTERAAAPPAASLPASSGPPRSRRRGAPGAFVAAAVVAAAVVSWQLVGLLGGMRAPGVPADPAGNAASDAVATAMSGVASSVARDAQGGVKRRAEEVPAAAKPGMSPAAGEPLGGEVAAPSLGSAGQRLRRPSLRWLRRPLRQRRDPGRSAGRTACGPSTPRFRWWRSRPCPSPRTMRRRGRPRRPAPANRLQPRTRIRLRLPRRSGRPRPARPAGAGCSSRWRSAWIANANVRSFATARSAYACST